MFNQPLHPLHLTRRHRCRCAVTTVSYRALCHARRDEFKQSTCHTNYTHDRCGICRARRAPTKASRCSSQTTARRRDTAPKRAAMYIPGYELAGLDQLELRSLRFYVSHLHHRVHEETVMLTGVIYLPPIARSLRLAPAHAA